MTKQEIRKDQLLKRKALSKKEIDTASQEISDLFFHSFPIKESSVIHIFLSIEKQNEINTWKIIHRLWKDFPSIQVVTSISDFEKLEIKSVSITQNTKVKTNKWQIPEPIEGRSIPNNLIDIVIVPLLAVDTKGHRVGYGKGFYDRFITTCKKEVLLIGVGLEAQKVSFINDINTFDKPLHSFISEKGLTVF
ncbi:MAG: 5-formyltetrahydrofolate cyclo-ligase [Cyclobacteriaceae bacterium]